ncbi:hypothetical protein MRX96_058537 [Rhipicephalus microplus]
MTSLSPYCELEEREMSNDSEELCDTRRGPPLCQGLKPNRSASRCRLRRLVRRHPLIRTSVDAESTTTRCLATTRGPCPSSTRLAVTTTATVGVTHVLHLAAACGRPCPVVLSRQVAVVRPCRRSWRCTTLAGLAVAMMRAGAGGSRRTSTSVQVFFGPLQSEHRELDGIFFFSQPLSATVFAAAAT